VYNITCFKNLHPAGALVFAKEDIGTFCFRGSVSEKLKRGPSVDQNVTEAYYGLHRHEVLL